MSTESSTSNNGKLVAILSYIFWIIAIIIHYVGGNKTKLGAYHLRQVLGLAIALIVVEIVFFIIAFLLGLIGIAALLKVWGIIGLIVYLGFIVLWVLGLISAIKGEEKPMPVIGAKIQSILGGLFN